MFKQLYNYNKVYQDDPTKDYVALWDPKFGATKYEMLYIDGMTIGRGFNMVIDQAFLWDNMIEISYPLVENILQAEVFVSAPVSTAALGGGGRFTPALEMKKPGQFKLAAKRDGPGASPRSRRGLPEGPPTPGTS